MGPSISSRTLKAIFESEEPLDIEVAKAVTEAKNADGKTAFHRTDLWRYRTGKGKPSADSIALLERLTGGRVPANGWEDLPSVSDRDRSDTDRDGPPTEDGHEPPSSDATSEALIAPRDSNVTNSQEGDEVR